MPDPQPALAPAAAAFLDYWGDYVSGSLPDKMRDDLAALLAAERRATWEAAAEVAHSYAVNVCTSSDLRKAGALAVASILRDHAGQEREDDHA